MTQPQPAQSKKRILAAILLAALMLILALRLTMTESFRMTLNQLAAQITSRYDPSQLNLPEVGPAVTFGLGALVTLLAALSAWCAARANALTRSHLAKFALIATLLTLAMISTFSAANRFYALVGTVDLATALLGAYAISLLCHQNLLANLGRRIVIATLIAILAAWTAKGLYQRISEIPATISYYQDNKEKALAAQGMRPDDPETKLFESRMMSKEVGGFVTLSNVMATGMVGLTAVLTGLLAASLFCRQSEKKQQPQKPVPNKSHKTPDDNIRDYQTRKLHGSTQIPLLHLLLCCGSILLLASLLTTFLTASRGGSAMAILCAITLPFAIWKRNWITHHRKKIRASALFLFLLIMLFTLAYGLRYDTLPSKSMMFRWHYWTASAQIIKDHPLTGVGLNNFGDYYDAYKRPSTPEDVKDPHSFFVRIASEIGLPAALLTATLLLWLYLTTTRKQSPITQPDAHPPAWKLITTGSLAILAWWLLHFAISDPSEDYSLDLDLILTVIAAAAWTMAILLTEMLTPQGLRAVILSCLVGALAMFVYDQINMALVTGQVAMLFWFLLAAADSYEPRPAKSPGKILALLPAFLCTAAAAAIALFAWLPTLRSTMPWDPQPYEQQYEEALLHRGMNGNTPIYIPNFPAAETAIEAAIARAPRTVDFLRQRIIIRIALRKPVADDLRQIFSLDRTNARFRSNLALEDTDLPPSERIAILQDALHLDQQLPPDEVKRLTQTEITQIHQTITRLQSQPH